MRIDQNISKGEIGSWKLYYQVCMFVVFLMLPACIVCFFMSRVVLELQVHLDNLGLKENG